MSEVLESLRAELRTHLGADPTDLTDNEATSLLNRAYWELLDKFPFRAKEAKTTITALGGASLVLLPTNLEAITKVSIEDSANNKVVLDRMTVDFYEANYKTNVESQSIPQRYMRRDAFITLWPTPDKDYTLTLYYWEHLLDMINSSDANELPKNWQEIILMGAVYRGYMRLQDYERALAARSHWMNIISSTNPTESEEEDDSPRAGVRIRYGGYDW